MNRTHLIYHSSIIRPTAQLLEADFDLGPSFGGGGGVVDLDLVL